MHAFIPLIPTAFQQGAIERNDPTLAVSSSKITGKTTWLLMEALRQIEDPTYHGLILRTSFRDLNVPSGVLSMCHSWLAGTDAVWLIKRKTYRFKSGATLSFGALKNDHDHVYYAGSEFSFLGFEHLTEFSFNQFAAMRMRLRGHSLLRIRATAHNDVPNWFNDDPVKGAVIYW